MKLIIGGYAQGKLDYVKQTNNKITIFDCKENCSSLDELYADSDKNIAEVIVINHFHYFVRDFLKNHENDQNKNKLWLEHTQRLYNYIDKNPNLIIISDEIGNGIVPIDSFEREYREKTGRILIELASQAEEVIRVICKIGQKIK